MLNEISKKREVFYFKFENIFKSFTYKRSFGLFNVKGLLVEFLASFSGIEVVLLIKKINISIYVLDLGLTY